jgi:pimeloyl-ACP methyl ester carboxylesterase
MLAIPRDGRLHLWRSGNGSGPPIVIEQGAGGVAILWRSVHNALASSATVLSYDRRGLGWSDAADLSALTVDDRVEDLRELLQASAIPGPYLLVAHSYGGLIVRKFARKYPHLTAGLVLTDSVEEGVHFQPEVLKLYRSFRTILHAMALTQFLGLQRLWSRLFPKREAARQDPAQRAAEALFLRPRAYAGMLADVQSLERVPVAERSSWPAGTFGNLPVAVINHGKPFPGPFAVMEKYWLDGQRRLAALSTNSLFVTAERSNHMIQEDEPELVVDTILKTHRAATTGAGF